MSFTQKVCVPLGGANTSVTCYCCACCCCVTYADSKSSSAAALVLSVNHRRFVRASPHTWRARRRSPPAAARAPRSEISIYVKDLVTPLPDKAPEANVAHKFACLARVIFIRYERHHNHSCECVTATTNQKGVFGPMRSVIKETLRPRLKFIA